MPPTRLSPPTVALAVQFTIVVFTAMPATPPTKSPVMSIVVLVHWQFDTTAPPNVPPTTPPTYWPLSASELPVTWQFWRVPPRL